MKQQVKKFFALVTVMSMMISILPVFNLTASADGVPAGLGNTSGAIYSQDFESCGNWMFRDTNDYGDCERTFNEHKADTGFTADIYDGHGTAFGITTVDDTKALTFHSGTDSTRVDYFFNTDVLSGSNLDTFNNAESLVYQMDFKMGRAPYHFDLCVDNSGVQTNENDGSANEPLIRFYNHRDNIKQIQCYCGRSNCISCSNASSFHPEANTWYTGYLVINGTSGSLTFDFYVKEQGATGDPTVVCQNQPMNSTTRGKFRWYNWTSHDRGGHNDPQYIDNFYIYPLSTEPTPEPTEAPTVDPNATPTPKPTYLIPSTSDMDLIQDNEFNDSWGSSTPQWNPDTGFNNGNYGMTWAGQGNYQGLGNGIDKGGNKCLHMQINWGDNLNNYGDKSSVVQTVPLSYQGGTYSFAGRTTYYNMDMYFSPSQKANNRWYFGVDDMWDKTAHLAGNDLTAIENNVTDKARVMFVIAGVPSDNNKKDIYLCNGSSYTKAATIDADAWYSYWLAVTTDANNTQTTYSLYMGPKGEKEADLANLTLVGSNTLPMGFTKFSMLSDGSGEKNNTIAEMWMDFLRTYASDEEPAPSAEPTATPEPTAGPTAGPTEEPLDGIPALKVNSSYIPANYLFYENCDSLSGWWLDGGHNPSITQDRGGNNIIQADRTTDDLRFYRSNVDAYGDTMASSGITYQYNLYVPGTPFNSKSSGIFFSVRAKNSPDKIVAVTFKPSSDGSVIELRSSQNGDPFATIAPNKWHTMAVSFDLADSSANRYSYDVYADGVKLNDSPLSLTVNGGAMGAVGFHSSDWGNLQANPADSVIYIDNLYGYAGDAIIGTEEPEPSQAPEYLNITGQRGNNKIDPNSKLLDGVSIDPNFEDQGIEDPKGTWVGRTTRIRGNDFEIRVNADTEVSYVGDDGDRTTATGWNDFLEAGSGAGGSHVVITANLRLPNDIQNTAADSAGRTMNTGLTYVALRRQYDNVEGKHGAQFPLVGFCPMYDSADNGYLLVANYPTSGDSPQDAINNCAPLTVDGRQVYIQGGTDVELFVELYSTDGVHLSYNVFVNGLQVKSGTMNENWDLTNNQLRDLEFNSYRAGGKDEYGDKDNSNQSGLTTLTVKDIKVYAGIVDESILSMQGAYQGKKASYSKALYYRLAVTTLQNQHIDLKDLYIQYYPNAMKDTATKKKSSLLSLITAEGQDHLEIEGQMDFKFISILNNIPENQLNTMMAAEFVAVYDEYIGSTVTNDTETKRTVDSWNSALQVQDSEVFN